MAKGREKKKYECTHEGCKASFPRPSKRAIHMQLHEGKIPFPCDAEGCDKGFTTKAHLRRHQSIQHENTLTRVMCTEEHCIKEFSNVANMKRHINRAHNPDRVYSYTCNDCDQSFPKKKLLHQHSYLHTGQFHYKCARCSDGFHLLSELNRHMRMHSLHCCNVCNAKYESFSDMRKHKLIHRKLYKCSVCNYKTYSKIVLRIHAQAHVAAEKREQFKCYYKECKRAYFHLRNLKVHIESFHLGQKKTVPCSIQGCPKMLSKVNALKNHIELIHNKQLPVFKRPRAIRKDAGKSKTNIILQLIGREIQKDPDLLFEVKPNILDDLYKEIVETW